MLRGLRATSAAKRTQGVCRPRGFRVESSPESIRATQLFRTLPHEVGHYVDYLTFGSKVECEHDGERFWELYSAKPSRDKEAFAHRYASEFRAMLEADGQIPFEQIRRLEGMREEGLDPDWFGC